MIVTAWNNGYHRSSGAGYGLKVRTQDRDRFFRREWGTVTLEFPGRDAPAEINIDKESFWGPSCRELICKEIGLWLRENNFAPWRKRRPPKFELEPLYEARFRLVPI